LVAKTPASLPLQHARQCLWWGWQAAPRLPRTRRLPGQLRHAMAKQKMTWQQLVVPCQPLLQDSLHRQLLPLPVVQLLAVPLQTVPRLAVPLLAVPLLAVPRLPALNLLAP